MSEWIPVSERLPEQFDHVIISDGKYVTTSYFQDNDFVGMEIYLKDVSHWMPLPSIDSIKKV